MDITTEQTTPTGKVYTIKTIRLGTFIGGPLIAGYLIGENYKTFGSTDKAKKSVIIGVVSTLLLFAVLFSLPEKFVAKVPSFIIPLVYMLITEAIVKKHQGEALEAHAENGGSFYSVWRAVGLGLVFAVVMLAGLFGYFSLLYNGGENLYNSKMDEFAANEKKALELFSRMDTYSDAKLLQELTDTDIPAWEANIAIIKTVDTISGLEASLKQQNKLLLEYAELRLREFKIYEKLLREHDNTAYQAELKEILDKIKEVLEKINK